MILTRMQRLVQLMVLFLQLELLTVTGRPAEAGLQARAVAPVDAKAAKVAAKATELRARKLKLLTFVMAAQRQKRIRRV